VIIPLVSSLWARGKSTERAGLTVPAPSFAEVVVQMWPVTEWRASVSGTSLPPPTFAKKLGA